MLLMAVDPGPHIGLAYKLPDGRYFTCTLLEPEELWALMRTYKPNHVAFETFYTGGRVDANMIHTIELVGSIHGICYALDIPLHRQMPQARKSFLPDAAATLHKHNGRGATKHEHDALAHLLCLEYRLERGDLSDRTTTRSRREVPVDAGDDTGAIRATQG